MPSSRLVLSAIAALAGPALVLAAAGPPLRAQGGAPVTITVQASRPAGPVTPRHGLLHGLDGTAAVDRERIAALRPPYWRLGKWQTYDLAVQIESVEIVFGLGSLYRWITGPDNARPWEDWAGWESFVGQVLAYIDQRYPDAPPDYLDVWPEPNLPYFWHGDYDQLLEAFARAARVAREHGSSAKLVGPSVSAYAPGAAGVAGVVDFVVDLEARHGVRLDAVSWHEFVGTPDGIPARAARLRGDLAARLAPGPAPELHVNEHLTASRHLSPGWNVGYLYYFEQAGVDGWGRACWSVRELDGAESVTYGGCWAGQSGLLLRDGTTPQPAWWVYKAYADGEGGQRLPTSSTDERTVALADRDDEGERVRLLVGRYGRTGPAEVTLRVAGWPYGGRYAAVRIARIPQGPDATTSPPLATGLPAGPEKMADVMVPVVDGTIPIAIPSLADGDAYLVEITPAARAIVPRAGR